MARYAENFARRAAGELSPLEALHAYLALCQSSGFGKSSLVAALKPNLENVIFDICLRAEHAQGEPRRTHLVAKLMEDCTTPTDFLAIIVACLEAMRAEMLPGVRKSLWRAIFPGETPEPFWASVAQKVTEVRGRAEPFAELASHGNELVEDIVLLGAKRILFSVDEAAILCKTSPREGSKFEMLSKALSAFSRNLSGLFLDTNSRIGDFILGGSAFRGSLQQEWPRRPILVIHCLSQLWNVQNSKEASKGKRAAHAAKRRKRGKGPQAQPFWNQF